MIVVFISSFLVSHFFGLLLLYKRNKRNFVVT